MKPLAILVAAVAVLLLAWLLVGGVVKSRRPAILLPENPADAPAMVRSAHQLWRAAPRFYDPDQVLAHLRLLNEHLDDAHWRAVSAAAFYAWRNQRDITTAREGLGRLNEVLLPRFARAGTLPELEALIRIGNTHAFDSDAIHAALARAAVEPLRPEGYEGSRLSLLVAAALRAGDSKRAADYLSRVSWLEGAPPALPAPMERAKAAVDVSFKAESGKYDLKTALSEWRSQAEEPLGPAAFRPALENVGIRLLTTASGPSDGTRIGELFAASVAEEAGQEYWRRIIRRFVPLLIDGDPNKRRNLGIVANGYGERFGPPEFESSTWMRAGDLAAKRSPKDPLKSAGFFRLALSSAPSDPLRLEALRRIVAGYTLAAEFQAARETAEETARKVEDPKVLEDLKPLLEEVRKKCVEDEARVALQKKLIEQDRLRGRLDHMKERLAFARSQGRGSEEIQALERTIRDLERQMTE